MDKPRAKAKKSGSRNKKTWNATREGKSYFRERKEAEQKGRKRHTGWKRKQEETSGKRRSLSISKKKMRVEKPECTCWRCKQAGRRYHHPAEVCKYAPGGEWHGKSKEQVQALQVQYYKNKKKQEASALRTNATRQTFPRRKGRREEEHIINKREIKNEINWQHSCNIADAMQVNPVDDRALSKGKSQQAHSCSLSTPGVGNGGQEKLKASSSPGVEQPGEKSEETKGAMIDECHHLASLVIRQESSGSETEDDPLLTTDSGSEEESSEEESKETESECEVEPENKPEAESAEMSGEASKALLPNLTSKDEQWGVLKSAFSHW